MNLKIIHRDLIKDFRDSVDKNFLKALNAEQTLEIPVDYFQFYTSVSSVYSSKIEGEDIDFDSYFKHRFQKVQLQPDYTKRTDDLYKAYEFIFENTLSLENLKTAHALFTSNLLPKSGQGILREVPMFVINSNDKIEYVATSPDKVEQELQKLFSDIEQLLSKEMDEIEVFYFAAHIHLSFVKIHPFLDGNGRAGRLLEKWFLKEKLKKRAVAVPLERNYYNNLTSYYANIRKIGLEYDDLDYSRSLDFLMMTISSLTNEVN